MDRLRKERVTLVCMHGVLKDFLENNEARTHVLIDEVRTEIMARETAETKICEKDEETIIHANEYIAVLISERDGLISELEKLELLEQSYYTHPSLSHFATSASTMTSASL